MINTQQLRQEQTEKAQQIILTDQFTAPTCIAGADVGFEEGGAVTRAAIVIMHYPSLKFLNTKSREFLQRFLISLVYFHLESALRY